MEMGMEMHTPMIYEDNNGSRRLAMNGMGQKNVRHLNIKYHYIQSLCESGDAKIKRIHAHEQPADLLTEGGHSSKNVIYFREKLGMVM